MLQQLEKLDKIQNCYLFCKSKHDLNQLKLRRFYSLICENKFNNYINLFIYSNTIEELGFDNMLVRFTVLSYNFTQVPKCGTGIWTSLIWLWWFNLRLK